MPYPYNQNYTNLFIKTLEDAGTGSAEHFDMLTALYEMKSKMIIEYRNDNQEAWAKMFDMECSMRDVLDPALVKDPSVIQFKDKKLEQHYNVFGYNYKFKVDTGAVTNVIDAEPNWDISNEQKELLMSAYKHYVKIYPDDGAMTKEKLLELPPEFHGADFGSVASFNLTTYRKGKNPVEDKLRGENAVTHTVLIDGPFPVIGVSAATKNSVKAEVPTPVIATDFIVPNTNEVITTAVALKPRNMTVPGLLSRVFLDNQNLMVMPESYNSFILDLDKIDYPQVEKIIQHFKI